MERQNIEFRAPTKVLTKEGANAEEIHRPGCLADVISQKTISHVERVALNDHRIKVAKLASECVISNRSVFTLINEHSGMSKYLPGGYPETSAKGGVMSTISGSIQCQSRRLSHLSWNRR